MQFSNPMRTKKTRLRQRGLQSFAAEWHLINSQQIHKLLDRQLGLVDLVAQESRSQNTVQGDRQRVDGSGLDQNDMAAALTGYSQPAFSNARTASRPEMRGSLGIDGDLNFPAFDGERHALLAPHF